LAIVSAGVLPLAAIAISMNETQGHVASRSAVYAQDKLEQLMALAYGDVTSDTREFPAPELGGSGLTVGGSVDPDAPVALYADYLDMQGTPIPAPDGLPAGTTSVSGRSPRCGRISSRSPSSRPCARRWATPSSGPGPP
jgi:hypothetical protein